MYYVKNSLGEEIPITNTNVFTHCPKCGVEHKADLVSLIIEHGEDCTGDILDSSMHCEECSKAHLPMYERMDEIEFVASRFPGTSVGTGGGDCSERSGSRLLLRYRARGRKAGACNDHRAGGAFHPG